LRIVVISDTHELHREVNIPPADILIHAGDWTYFSRKLSAVDDFDRWLASLPIRLACIASPGNHEIYLEADPSHRYLTPNATVLIGEGTTMKGLKIWASPVTSIHGGAFGLSSPVDRSKYYAQIPADTHVLITHGPPYGILDCEPGSSDHYGDPELRQAVLRIKPRLHIFGHVHTGHGMQTTEDTTFVNAALLGVHGGIEHEPLVFDINPI
jgi:predicted phosphodiesterase